MKKDTRYLLPCLCLRCGVRNDFSHPNGFCQNGHDDWLEFRDVDDQNEHFQRALRLTGLSATELESRFLDPLNTQIPIIER